MGRRLRWRSSIRASVSVDKKIEKAYYDRDLLASDAIFSLYSEGILVTRLQRALSIGMFGEGRETAVRSHTGGA